MGRGQEVDWRIGVEWGGWGGKTSKEGISVRVILQKI